MTIGKKTAPSLNMMNAKEQMILWATEKAKLGTIMAGDMEIILSEAKNGKVMIDLSKATPMLFAKDGYVTATETAPTTIRAGAVKSLYNNPEQFFDKDGKVDIGKIRMLLPGYALDNSSQEDGYELQLTGKYVKDKDGKTFKAVIVGKDDILNVFREIREMGIDVTVADLKALAKELDLVMRALQELAIDVAKDINKKMDVNVGQNIAMPNVASRLFNSTEHSSNLDKILKGEEKVYSISTLLDSMKPISEVDYVTEDNKDFVYIVDNNVGNYIKEGAEAAMNIFVGHYQDGKDQILNRTINDIAHFIGGAVAERDFSVAALITSENENDIKAVKVCRIALDTINGLYMAKDEDDIKLYSSKNIKDMAAKIRNAVYTELVDVLGIAKGEVIRYAVAAAYTRFWCKTFDQKTRRRLERREIITTDKANGSLTALMDVFPKEFVKYYAGFARVDYTLKVKYQDDDLYEGMVLEFNEGVAEWIYEGESVVNFCEVQENYTGLAKVTPNGILALIDICEYDPVEALFMDSINKGNIIPTVVNKGALDFDRNVAQVTGYDPEADKDISVRVKTVEYLAKSNRVGIKGGNLVAFSDDLTKVSDFGTIVNPGELVAVKVEESIFTRKTAMVFLKK